MIGNCVRLISGMWSFSSPFLAHFYLLDSVRELSCKGSIGENVCIRCLSDPRQALKAVLVDRSRISDIEE